MSIRALIALLIITAAPPDSLPQLYRRAHAYDHRNYAYAAPSPERLGKVRALFTALSRAIASGPPPAALIAQAQDTGFELAAGRDRGGQLWIVREPEGRRGGDGFYVLRAGGLPVCLQAPHTFFDEGTGPVAIALFRALGAACLATNTISRRKLDVAHAESSVFLAATEGLLAGSRWPIVQVHGFGESEAVPAGVAAILSEGTLTTTVAERLGRAMEKDYGRVLVYRRDTHALGATKNRQGAAAHAAGATFLHLELSLELRRALRKSPEPLAAALRSVLAP